MKKLIVFIGLLVYGNVFGQVPQAFNYQGIARDANGTPIINTNISLRITLNEGGTPGLEVYKETHFVQTNKLGLFSLEIGHGTTVAGVFQDIQWGSGDHFIQIEIDPAGGQNFVQMGVAQLLSVPYALYAGFGTSQWQDNDNGIHYNKGNVGIGSDYPLQKLSIEGNDDDGAARNYVSVTNKSLSNRSAAILSLSAGNNDNQTNLIHLSETYDFENNDFNDFGQLDSRGAGLLLTAPNSTGVIRLMTNHTSLTNAPIERMRIASDGHIGIGTRNPIQLLSIEGNDDDGAGRNYVSITNTSLSNRSAAILSLSAGNNTNQTNLIHLSETYDFENNDFNDFGQLDSRGAGLLLTAPNTTGVIRFFTNHAPVTNAPIERMRITADGKVGIGTRNPIGNLDIVDSDNVSTGVNYITLHNTSLGDRSGVAMMLSAGDDQAFTTIGHHSETYNFEGDKYSDFGQVRSTGKGLILRSDANNSVIKFLVGNTGGTSFLEHMRITSTGNIGIGTEDPVSRLQVTNGDVYIENISNGVIMKSPSGNCWRVTVADDGTLKTASISCPN